MQCENNLSIKKKASITEDNAEQAYIILSVFAAQKKIAI